MFLSSHVKKIEQSAIHFVEMADNLSWVLAMLALEHPIALRRWFCGFLDGFQGNAVFLWPRAFQKAQDHQDHQKRPKDTKVMTSTWAGVCSAFLEIIVGPKGLIPGYCPAVCKDRTAHGGVFSTVHVRIS